jgi:hypothetical protein
LFESFALAMDRLQKRAFDDISEAGPTLVEYVITSLGESPAWQKLKSTIDDISSVIQSKNELIYKLLHPKPGGSKPGRLMIRRNFTAAYETLWQQYFQPNPVYSDTFFKRRFRMSKLIFLRVYEACMTHPYFLYSPNAAGRWGIHPLVKITAVLRHFAYGIPADGLDDHYHMSETSVLDSRKAFCEVSVPDFKFVLRVMRTLGDYSCVWSEVLA